VLYPTTYEGFGLMPFEAAAHDRPCLFASHTALAETLPQELAALVPWDAQASAARAQRLLGDPEATAEQVRRIRQAGRRFTWKSTGEALADTYLNAAASPARDAARMAADLAQVEREREEAERKYEELWQSLTPDARQLVAPDGPLSSSQTHTLAAVARRPLLRRLVLGPIHLAYRATGLFRPREQAPEPETPPQTFALHFGASNLEHMREQLAPSDAEQLIAEP
jgi:Family 4 Glycosyltransferase in conflict systems